MKSRTATLQSNLGSQSKTKSKFAYVMGRLYQERSLYFLFLPVFLYYLIFCYIPMGGLLLAFKKYNAALGIFWSENVGFDNFTKFFQSYNFGNVLWNTFRINIVALLFSFPAPIILALSLNEIKYSWFKKPVQTITYLPHFVSVVVLVGFISNIFSLEGLVNSIRGFIGLKPIIFMQDAKYFTGIFVGSGIWQQIGWNSIIYLAAIAGIDQELYEAADIDGAGRFRKIWHITIQQLSPTIVILLIMQIGSMLNVGYEKIILMQNSLNASKSEVISSYVYKLGFGNYPDYGRSTAVGLFNTIVNLTLLTIANKISRKVSEVSLW